MIVLFVPDVGQYCITLLKSHIQSSGAHRNVQLLQGQTVCGYLTTTVWEGSRGLQQFSDTTSTDEH